MARDLTSRRAPFDVMEFAGRHRVLDLQLNLTIHFPEDFNANHLLAELCSMGCSSFRD
jgi:hypothetical protein